MRLPVHPASRSEIQLRHEVRRFLDDALPPARRTSLGMAAEHDPGFSRELASRGWVGMSIPTVYGGGGRTAVDRFVVTEELLAAQAPVGAHWIADRQTAPAILRYGSEEQRRRFLPAIARGECYFSIGMSEPDAGSDLASVTTRAVHCEGGWRLEGTKVWTSGAHRNHFIVVLCRTEPPTADRHAGLSQLIVDLADAHVRIRPITTLDGRSEFCEVAFDGALVPDAMVLGQPGAGWRQATSELAFERFGPERWLSPWALFARLVAETTDAHAAAPEIGRLFARYRVIRQMSLAVARLLDSGIVAEVQAAAVKDLGTIFERDLVETVRWLVGRDLDPGSDDAFERLLADAILTAPGFTLRGGTTEILRGLVARSLRT